LSQLPDLNPACSTSSLLAHGDAAQTLRCDQTKAAERYTVGFTTVSAYIARPRSLTIAANTNRMLVYTGALCQMERCIGQGKMAKELATIPPRSAEKLIAAMQQRNS
jgi:hypothetical protein